MAIVNSALFTYNCEACFRQGVIRLSARLPRPLQHACPGCGEAVELEWDSDIGAEPVRSPHRRRAVRTDEYAE